MTPEQAATVARIIEENHSSMAGTVPDCALLMLGDYRTFLVRPDGSYQRATLGTMHPAKSPQEGLRD